MLTLYVKTDCPYAARVFAAMDEMKLHATIKNVGDTGIADELIARGGRLQSPYLVDDSCNIEMYDCKINPDGTPASAEMYGSSDIVDYLKETYGTSDKQ